MPNKTVIAQSPVSFGVDGRQMLLPLSTLYFDAGGALKAERWPSYAANKATLDPYLDALRARGVLTAGPATAPNPALKVEAKHGGTASIVVIVANVAPNANTPADGTADVTVTETNTYELLTPGTLKSRVGTAAGGGSSPGLVFVSSAAEPLLPKVMAETAMAAVAAGGPATLEVPKRGAAGTAFSLQSRDAGADAILTTVAISSVDAPAGTFTLVVKWTKRVTVTKLSALKAAFAYSVSIEPPDGGIRTPSEGQQQLVGGADPVPARSAEKSTGIIPTS
jgi:hypothetical protein